MIIPTRGRNGKMRGGAARRLKAAIQFLTPKINSIRLASPLSPRPQTDGELMDQRGFVSVA